MTVALNITPVGQPLHSAIFKTQRSKSLTSMDQPTPTSIAENFALKPRQSVIFEEEQQHGSNLNTTPAIPVADHYEYISNNSSSAFASQHRPSLPTGSIYAANPTHFIDPSTIMMEYYASQMAGKGLVTQPPDSSTSTDSLWTDYTNVHSLQSKGETPGSIMATEFLPGKVSQGKETKLVDVAADGSVPQPANYYNENMYFDEYYQFPVTQEFHGSGEIKPTEALVYPSQMYSHLNAPGMIPDSSMYQHRKMAEYPGMSLTGGIGGVGGAKSNSLSDYASAKHMALNSPSYTISDPNEIAAHYKDGSKPPFSYASLIAQAILATSDQRMTLSSIYQWIIASYPYYANQSNGWQNSIRHNLSLNKCFIKLPRSEHESGKGAFWTFDPNFLHLYENGYLRKRRVKLPSPKPESALLDGGSVDFSADPFGEAMGLGVDSLDCKSSSLTLQNNLDSRSDHHQGNSPSLELSDHTKESCTNDDNTEETSAKSAGSKSSLNDVRSGTSTSKRNRSRKSSSSRRKSSSAVLNAASSRGSVNGVQGHMMNNGPMYPPPFGSTGAYFPPGANGMYPGLFPGYFGTIPIPGAGSQGTPLFQRHNVVDRLSDSSKEGGIDGNSSYYYYNASNSNLSPTHYNYSGSTSNFDHSATSGTAAGSSAVNSNSSSNLAMAPTFWSPGGSAQGPSPFTMMDGPLSWYSAGNPASMGYYGEQQNGAVATESGSPTSSQPLMHPSQNPFVFYNAGNNGGASSYPSMPLGGFPSFFPPPASSFQGMPFGPPPSFFDCNSSQNSASLDTVNNGPFSGFNYPILTSLTNVMHNGGMSAIPSTTQTGQAGQIGQASTGSGPVKSSPLSAMQGSKAAVQPTANKENIQPNASTHPS